MDKYIICNCPNLGRFGECNENSLIRQKCADNDRCLLKRINNTCSEVIAKHNQHCGTNPYSMGMCISAERVSELLEINEVE